MPVTKRAFLFFLSLIKYTYYHLKEKDRYDRNALFTSLNNYNSGLPKKN